MCGKVQRKVLIKTNNGSLFGTMDQYHMTCKKCNKNSTIFLITETKGTTMNDSINMAWLRLQSKLSCFKKELQTEILDDIKGLVELEQKAIKNLQLIEVQAMQLRPKDIIFDPNKKSLHKISYCEYRKKCQFNAPNDNKEILVMYGEDEPTDYFDQFSTLFILVDIGEIASIHTRPEPEWEEDE